MYTLIQIFSGIIVVAAVIFVIVLVIIQAMTYDDAKSELKHPILYNANTAKLKMEKAVKQLKKVWVFIPIIVIGLMLCFISAREIDRDKCQTYNGTFRVWDNGMQWKCLNPNDISSNNNFRILTESLNKE